MNHLLDTHTFIWFLNGDKVLSAKSRKTIQELNKSKIPIVAIDSSLGKYRDKTPFPKKLEIATRKLKSSKLPNKKH